MVGSKKYFVYTTDSGNDFAILLDESNTEAVNAGTQDYVDGLNIRFLLPSNISPRRAVYQNAAKTRTISCVCLTQTVYNGVLENAATITDPVGSGTLTLSQLIPEKLKLLPIAADTGQTDGDAT